jgi:hypothetical protein
MSVLGKDFEDAMKQLSATLMTASDTLNALRAAIAKANAILDKINSTLK